MKKKRVKKMQLNYKNIPEEAKDLPASMGQVNELRNKMVAGYASLDAKIDKVAAEIKAIALESRQLVHNSLLIAEEQRNENRAMYEVIIGMIRRADRHEKRLDDHDETFRLLAKKRPQ